MKRKRTCRFTQSSVRLVLALSALISTAGCGGIFSGGTDKPSATVSIDPPTPAIRTGATVQFTAMVSHSTNASVTWSVNGIAGGTRPSAGSAQPDSIARRAKLPTPNPVTIEATSAADSKVSGSTEVTVQNPVPALTSVLPTSIPTGNFTLSVSGTKFISGAVVVWGDQFLTTKYVSATELRATGSESANGPVKVTVLNPDPGSASSRAITVQVGTASSQVTPQAAARFLEQSSWGPTPASISAVQAAGLERFLGNQFNIAASVYPAPAKEDGIDAEQELFFRYAVRGSDQLRQRVAFALSEIMVVSANKVNDPSAFVLWQNMFQKDAFGNFSTPTDGRHFKPDHGQLP